MTKHICIVGTAHPFRGGMAAFNERLAHAFLQKGYRVTLFTFTLQYPGILFPGKTQYSDAPKPDGLDIRATLSSVNPISWVKTGNMIKKMNPDIVMINYWLPFMAPAFGTIGRIIHRNKKSRIISIIHNIIPHEKRLGDKWLSKYYVQSTDAFLALSKSVLKDLDTFDNKKPKAFNPHPLYDHFGTLLGKEVAKEKLNLDKDKKYILFFGFIRDYKGLDILLKAYKILHEQRDDIRLLVAGEFYANAQKYHQLIDELGIRKLLDLHTDFIPDDAVADYFSAADVVAQPYKTATQSGVTQIAYHFEKPMVVTRVGGLSELVPHNKVGYVVEPNEEALAAGLRKYFEEEKELDFIKNMAEEKKKYSWKLLIEKIEALENQLKEA